MYAGSRRQESGRNLVCVGAVPHHSHTSSLTLWLQKRRMKGYLQLSIKGSGNNNGGLCVQMFVILL